MCNKNNGFAPKDLVLHQKSKFKYVHAYIVIRALCYIYHCIQGTTTAAIEPRSSAAVSASRPHRQRRKLLNALKEKILIKMPRAHAAPLGNFGAAETWIQVRALLEEMERSVAMELAEGLGLAQYLSIQVKAVPGLANSSKV